MAREVLEPPKKERTTVILLEVLMQHVSTHVSKDKEDNFTSFVERAFINQLEQEGDISIRQIVEGINNGY